MKILKRKTVFTIMLLMLVTFVPMVSAQAETLSDSSDVKQVTLTLKDGILTIPSDDKKTTDLNTATTTEKLATAFLSGTIDENNFVTLEGVINLDEKEERIELKGKATQEFIGWDVPEGAKPIYSTVGDEKIGYVTITRYEGATERYATFIDFVDEDNKYNLHGIFHQDGHGGLAGIIISNETECNVVLKGLSTSLYENVIPVESTRSSLYITVPYRSQWELCLDEGYSYSAASQACGVAVCAMLEEFYNSNSPDLGPIWDEYGSMNTVEAEEYLQSQDIDVDRRSHTGSLSFVIEDCAQYYIDTGRPFYLKEESMWGNSHAVVLRGYNDDSEYFKLNDPNDASGTNTMYWYESDNPSFNFEENVYEYSGDLYSNGMLIVV